MEVSGQLHTRAALPLGKEPLVPIGKGSGWAPELVSMQKQRKEVPSPCWELSPSSPAHSLVNILTELSQFPQMRVLPAIFINSNLGDWALCF